MYKKIISKQETLEIIDDFMRGFCGVGIWEDDWEEADDEDIKKWLESLSGKYILDVSSEQYSDRLPKNKVVIPYAFAHFKATPKNSKVKKILLECLDYHETFTNDNEIKNIQFFKDNFEGIISGNTELKKLGE